MKKSLFILLIAAFLGSCEGEFDDVTYTIKNDSSKNIKFTFNDTEKTLVQGTSIVYTVNYQQGRLAPKIDYIGMGIHRRSINAETKNNGTAGIFFTFTDNKPFKLEVENTLLIPITVKAGDFIAAGEDTNAEAYDENKFTLKIGECKEETAKETALIYTSAPNFSVTESAKEERTLDPAEIGYFIPYPYPYPIKFDVKSSDTVIKLTIK